MRYNNKIILFLALALVLSAAICAIFISPGFRYKAEILSESKFSYNNHHLYFDLDNDDRTEKISLIGTNTSRTGMIVYDDTGELIDQYNFAGTFVPLSEICAADVQGDSKKELILFTYTGDSLSIVIFDPLGREDGFSKSLFVDRCSLLDGEAKYRISKPLIFDGNSDGYNEIFFAVSAGFTLSPRKLYSVDLKNSRVNSSPESGFGLSYFIDTIDINRDGIPEIASVTSAPGNYKKYVPHSDSISWIMLFNTSLKYVFDPLPALPYPSMVFPLPLKNGDEKGMIMVLVNKGNNESASSSIIKLNEKGVIIDSLSLTDYCAGVIYNVLGAGGKIWIVNSKLKIYAFTTDLKYVGEISKGWMKGSIVGKYDVIGGRDDELIFADGHGKITVTDLSGRRLLEFDIGDSSIIIPPLLKVNNAQAGTGIYLRNDKMGYLLSVKRSNSRLLFVIYLLLIFLCIFFLMMLVQYQVIRQEHKKRALENEIKQLQLVTLKNQVSPHFIFNALNSISSMYLRGDTLKADKFMTGFSKLIREVLVTSENPLVTLDEELEFVSSYLDLEQLRMGDDFKYSIKVSPGCRGITVPSMTLHMFVENSVKHGFNGLEGEKIIDISGIRRGNEVVLLIYDNGMGFSEKVNNKTSTGKGLMTISGIFKAYESLSGRKIKWEPGDLPPGRETGTVIKVTVEL